MIAEFNLDQPVQLADGSVLTISQVLRYLPNRRLVCIGLWQHQTIFAKLFIGKNAAKYAQRDKAGVMLLSQASIQTPTLLQEIALTAPQGWALIFELIAPAENAETLWQCATLASRLTLMQQLVNTVAQHHLAGLLQTDLYFKNFLVQGTHIYTLDGDGIRPLSGMFKKRQQLSNLATLFSKMDVLNDRWIKELYAQYCQKTGLPFSLRDDAYVPNLTKSIRIKVSSAYADKKVFRQCTDVNIRAKKGYFTAVASQFDSLPLPETAMSLDAVISSAPLLKEGNTCTVALATFADTRVVIKRYNMKDVLHRLSRLLRPTRAAASWANAHRLQLLGIATPKPVALIEQRSFSLFGNGLRGKAYFLSEYVDAPDMVAFFAETTDKNQRVNCIQQLVQLLYRLHLLNISHGDMKYSNIKVVDGMPMLIDLDSMQQHTCAYFAQKAHARDLRRFMQNWQADASLYNAFVKVFKVVYADHAPLNLAKL